MKNKIVHFEIPVDNVDRATKFYSEIFDWQIKKYDMPTGGEPYYMIYTVETDDKGMVKEKGGINGGLMKRKEPKQSFVNYVAVDDIDSMLSKIKEKGGRVCMEKTEIGKDMGWIAAFIDPEGNMMGLHEMAKKS